MDWNLLAQEISIIIRSHPVWVCGLKLARESWLCKQAKSHPVWVCGLKLPRKTERSAHRLSHPVWVCGLKPLNRWTSDSRKSHTLYGCVDWNLLCRIKYSLNFGSHPVWVCGLKLISDNIIFWAIDVTPCMGVWIETRRLSHRWRTFTVIPCMGVWIETPEVNLSHSLKTYRVSSLRSNFNSLF